MDPITMLAAVAVAIIVYLHQQGKTDAQIASAPNVPPNPNSTPPTIPPVDPGSTGSGGGGGPVPGPVLPVAPGAGGWQSSATSTNGSTVGRVWVRGDRMFFNSDANVQTIATGIGAHFLVCGMNANGVIVAACQDDTGACRIMTSAGANATPCGTVGVNPVGVRVLQDGSFQVYAYNPGPVLNVIAVNADGTVIGSPIPTTTDPGTGQALPGTSQGFLGILPNGSPRWTDTNRAIVLGGNIVTLATMAGEWAIGQANAGGVGVVAIRADGSVQRIYSGDVQIAPQVCITNDGRIDVGVTADPGGFYPTTAWRAEGSSNVPVPPIAPFTVAKVLGFYAIAPGTPGDDPTAIAPMNAIIQTSASWPNGAIVNRAGQVIAPWINLVDDSQKGLSIAQSIANANVTPAWIYFDGTDIDPSLATLTSPDDTIWFPWYRNQNEDINVFRNRCRAAARLIKSWGRKWGMVARADNRGFLSDAQVLECMPVYQQDATDGACQGIVFFGIGRGRTQVPSWYQPSYGQAISQFRSPGVPFVPPLHPPGNSSNTPGPTPPNPPDAGPSGPYAGPDPIVPGRGLETIRANFCNLIDADGMPIFTVGLNALWLAGQTAKWRDWCDRLRAAGSTHVFVSPTWKYNGSPYPLYANGADQRGDPAGFRRFLDAVIAEGFWPVVFWSECRDPGYDEINTYWPALLAAVRDLTGQMIHVPAWEPIPGTTWTPEILNYAIGVIATGCPGAKIHFHSSPDRSTGCGKDAGEGPDPWNHDEAGFWSYNNGVYLSGLIYETGHDGYVLDPVTVWNERVSGACGGGTEYNPTPQDSWINRWAEVVFRSCLGNCSWRAVNVCLGETVAANFLRGQCSPADAVRVARDGGRVAAIFGVAVGYGNGLPPGV